MGSQSSRTTLNPDRLLKTIRKHSANKVKWDKILQSMKEQRKDPTNDRFRKDASRKKIEGYVSPCNLSLIERS